MILLGAVLALFGLAIIGWAACRMSGLSTPDDRADDNEGNL